MIIDPTPKQKEAHKALLENQIVLYGGAIRGAKSYWGLAELITLSFTYKNSRWLALRKSRVVLEQTLLLSFKENFLEKGFGQYVDSFNQTDLILKWNNGSEIVFMGENYDTDKDLNRFRGLEINGAFIDEVNEIREKSFNKVIERSGTWFHSPGCPIKIFMSCNPTHNWVKDRFYDKWETNTLPKGIAYIPAKITDNPHVPTEYLESLKLLPEHEYEVFVNGRWDVKLEGVLFDKKDFKRFKRSDLVGKPDAVLAYADIADEGTDYFSAPFAAIYGNKIYITDVIFTQANVDTTLPELVAMFNATKCDYIRAESNNQGSVFIKMARQYIEPERVLKVTNSTNKHTRILMEYLSIKTHVYLLDESEYERGSPYDLFVRNHLTYMKDGSSDHDDGPDSLAGLVLFIKSYLSHLFG